MLKLISIEYRCFHIDTSPVTYRRPASLSAYKKWFGLTTNDIPRFESQSRHVAYVM